MESSESCNGTDSEQSCGCVSFSLKQLWEFYDEPYGLEVPIVIRGETQNVYFVPHLSGMQLYQGEQVVFEFYETLTPDLRYPLIDKIEELAREYPPLLEGNTNQFSRKSWYAIAWYPILCHNETMSWLKGQMITYHHFEPNTKLVNHEHLERTKSIDEALSSLPNSESKMYYAPLIGFLPYKVRNDTWFGEDDEYMQAPLYLVRACKNMMYEMQIQHPDFQHVIQNFRELALV